MAVNKEKLMLGGLRRILNGTARVYRNGAGRIAYYFLTTPRRLPSGEDDDWLDEAEAGRIDFEGEDIRTYYWPGKGPTVLLLHGWESSTARWKTLVPRLRRAGYAVHAIDAPAHGQSGGKKFSVFLFCEALERYLDQMGNTPDYWIGHSAGGMAAIYYCTDYGGRHCPRRIVAMAVPAYLENFIDKFCAMVGASPRVKDGIERQFVRHHAIDFATIDFTRFVKSLRIPGLIIHDENDDVAPLAGAEMMLRNWAGAEIVTTRGRGHSLTGSVVPAIILEYLEHCRTEVGVASLSLDGKVRG